MKVVQVSTWDTACGIARYTEYLREGLEAAGVETDVVAIDRERLRFLARRELRGYFSKLAEQLDGADVVHIQHEFGFFGGSYDYRSMVLEFRRFLKKAIALDVPVFTTFHTDPYFYASRGTPDLKKLVLTEPAKAFWRVSVPPLFNRNGRVSAIVHSRTARKDLIDSGIRPGNVVHVPHGIPSGGAQVVDPSVGPAVRARLGIPHDAVLLAIFGFVSSYKGHMTALRALKQLPNDYHLMFIGGMHPLGTDREFEHALDYVNKYPKLGPRLTVTGYQDDETARECLAAADMLLAPYVGDTTLSGSGALGWAMSSQRPVIASRIRPFVEMVAEEPCLELVTPDAPFELAHAIETLQGQPERRALLTAGASRYCQENSWGRVALMHAQLYAKALGRPVSPLPELAIQDAGIPESVPATVDLRSTDGPLFAGSGVRQARKAQTNGNGHRPRPSGRTERLALDVDDGLQVSFAIDPSTLEEDEISKLLAESGFPSDDPTNLLMRRLVSPGDTLIDIGAHIGTFSLPAAVAGARVISIEAARANVRLLESAADANDLADRMTIVHGAAGATGGEVIRFAERGPHGFVVGDEEGRAAKTHFTTYDVPVVAVDDLVAAQGLDRVDWVKLDIEGWELEALAGMAGLMKRSDAPTVLFESNANMLGHLGSTTRDLREAFESSGYSVFLVDREHGHRLIPFSPNDIQTENVVDMIAWKQPPELPDGWFVAAPLTIAETVSRLRSAAQREHEGLRQHAALAIVAAPPEVRDHPDNVDTLNALKWDSNVAVRNAALGATDPERYGIARWDALPVA